MNHDHIIIISAIFGAIPAFLLGYAKGHEHGKVAGRIALRREQKQLVSR
jgi:hypothetical protein